MNVLLCIWTYKKKREYFKAKPLFKPEKTDKQMTADSNCESAVWEHRVWEHYESFWKCGQGDIAFLTSYYDSGMTAKELHLVLCIEEAR